MRETLHLVLEEQFEVLEAPDGRTAIETACAAPVDLVLLDILMPGIDGLQTLARLQAVRPGLPVVVLSALDSAEPAATALRHGARDYLTKPVENERLLTAVGAALGRQARPGAPALGGAPCALALIGCEVGVVAGLAAMLHPRVEVRSHPDPPAINLGMGLLPALCVVDTTGRGADWLERAALLLEQLAGVRAVMLLDARSAPEARFVLGERCLTLEPPFRLTALLDLVCTLLPRVPARRAWSDARTAGVIDAVCDGYARFQAGPLADRLGVSRRYLSRCFHRHAGVSIGVYVTRVRVHAARHLLEHTGAKLDAVASVVGFHDASHLSRAFLRVTGHRPGEHRVPPGEPHPLGAAR